MNSTPADSNARLMTSRVARRGSCEPASNCRTVTIPTPALSASSAWLQSRSPRAALHCSAMIIRISICDRRRLMDPTARLRERRGFIGGSDARVIMGSDEQALIRLWREKRGEIELEDLSGNLVVQLGSVTEDLNRRWFERNSGQAVKDVQRSVRHPVLRWMGAT